jgi:membrane protease YdiL (CAAX protease family)
MEEHKSPVVPRFRWHATDLIAFVAVLGGVLFVVPLAIFLVLQSFRPGFQLADLSGVVQILLQGLLLLLLVGFIVFVIRVVHRQPLLESLRWVRRKEFSVIFFAAAGAFLAVTVLIVSQLFPPPGDSPLEKLLSTPASVVVFVIFGIAVAPLMEEIIFRGFLYTVLADVFSPGVAVPVVSILFAGLHVNQLRGNLPAVFLILGVGYALTVVRQRTDSLIPSVIMHTAYNTMIFGISGLSVLIGEGGKAAN